MKTYAVSEFLGSVVGDAFRAIPTGEKRPPKKGEYYLSGAIVTAWRAFADMTTPYRIAKVVRIEKVTAYKIVDHDPPEFRRKK